MEYLLKKKTNHLLYLKSFFKLLIILVLFFIAHAILLHLLSKATALTPSHRIIWANDLCANWDQKIFGVDVPFWLQSKNNPSRWIFDSLSPVLIKAYYSIIIVFGASLFLSLILNFSLFLRFLFSFTAILIISFPIWCLIPAWTPMDMYLNNLLDHTPPLSIQTSLQEYQPTESLDLFLQDMKKLSGNNSFGIASFPSMHIGWSILILYFCFELWSPLLFFIIPYTLLNGLATVFLLQHHAVDIISGIIVAIIAIFLSKKLIHYTDTNQELNHMFRNDFLAFRNSIKNIFHLQSVDTAKSNK